MKKIFLLSILLVGCSVPNFTAAPDDAGPDAEVDAGDHNDGKLCCRVTQELSDEYPGGYYGCDQDSGIYAGTPVWVPWICNVHTANEVDCHDPTCVVGSPCRAFNGYGQVEACNY